MQAKLAELAAIDLARAAGVEPQEPLERCTEALEDIIRRGGAPAIREAGLFFMKQDPVHQTLRRISRKLDELQIPYAIVGGMALVAHGYIRTTVAVDILMTAEGIAKAHQELEGLGFLPIFPDSRALRDTTTGVRIEFLQAGQFPGDGRPKPVAFPDPSTAVQEIDGIRYISLPQLIELKLASGMTSPGRIRDLADVQELIRTLQLDEAFAGKLNPYVREKYLELSRALRE